MNLKNQLIRVRIDTLLNQKGKKWSDIYSSEEVGISKSHASYIRNGILIPTLSLRIAICLKLDCDTSVIWSEDIMLDNEKQKRLEI